MTSDAARRPVFGRGAITSALSELEAAPAVRRPPIDAAAAAPPPPPEAKPRTGPIIGPAPAAALDAALAVGFVERDITNVHDGRRSIRTI